MHAERCRVLLPLGVGLVVALALAGCARTPGGEGLAGRMVGVDDTGLPDSPIGDGWMIAVPADRAADLWAVGGETQPPRDMSHAGVSLTEADLGALDGVIAELTDAGRFRLDVPTGDAVICWMRSRKGDVLSSWGCGEVDAPDDGSLRAAWGEGGFGVWVE